LVEFHCFGADCRRDDEHIVGQGWPETEVRQARLEEAIEIIRLLC
jgi:hypothetical protein